MDTRDQAGGPRAGATPAERAAFSRITPGRPGPGQRAQDLAQETIDRGTAAADAVRERVSETVEQGQAHAADKVEAVADSLRRSADAMPEDQGWLSDLTRRGARELSDMAETLRQNDLQGLLRRVDGFARSQPALFLGASMAAGFALARTAQVTVGRAATSRTEAAHPGARATSPAAPMADVTPDPRHDASAESPRPDMHHTEATHG